MTEMQLFNVAGLGGPTAVDSALLDWVCTEARREYVGPCPIRQYHALYSAAIRLCNPNLEKRPFPPVIADKVTAAFNAMFRTIKANMVIEASTNELRSELRAMRARPAKVSADEWYETLVTRCWIEEELRERAAIANATSQSPS